MLSLFLTLVVTKARIISYQIEIELQNCQVHETYIALLQELLMNKKIDVVLNLLWNFLQILQQAVG